MRARVSTGPDPQHSLKETLTTLPGILVLQGGDDPPSVGGQPWLTPGPPDSPNHPQKLKLEPYTPTPETARHGEGTSPGTQSKRLGRPASSLKTPSLQPSCSQGAHGTLVAPLTSIRGALTLRWALLWVMRTQPRTKQTTVPAPMALILREPPQALRRWWLGPRGNHDRGEEPLGSECLLRTGLGRAGGRLGVGARERGESGMTGVLGPQQLEGQSCHQRRGGLGWAGGPGAPS